MGCPCIRVFRVSLAGRAGGATWKIGLRLPRSARAAPGAKGRLQECVAAEDLIGAIVAHRGAFVGIVDIEARLERLIDRTKLADAIAGRCLPVGVSRQMNAVQFHVRCG